jgi:hypothetical protein
MQPIAIKYRLLKGKHKKPVNIFVKPGILGVAKGARQAGSDA